MKWVCGLAVFSLTVFAGCSSTPRDAGVPAGAGLVAEVVAPSGSRSTVPAKLEAEQGGALYVIDAARQSTMFHGDVKPGEVIHLYESGVAIAGQLKSKGMSKSVYNSGVSASMYERRVASFSPGLTYRVYFQPGARTEVDGGAGGSPLTQPYEERTIEKRSPTVPQAK